MWNCFVSLLCALLSSIRLPYNGSNRGLVFTVPSKLIVSSRLDTVHNMYVELTVIGTVACVVCCPFYNLTILSSTLYDMVSN